MSSKGVGETKLAVPVSPRWPPSPKRQKFTQPVRSKYLINDIPRGTTGVTLFNFLVSPPHWLGTGGVPTELQPHVHFSCKVSDSRLDDELSVAVLEFTDTPNWLQFADLDPYGFPKKTDLGTLWRWVDLAERDESGQTAFIRAAVGDNLIYTETLAEFPDTNVNAQDKEGRTALHWACAKGLPDMVSLCLSIPGCNTALRDHDDLTAFDIARLGSGDLVPDLFYTNMLEMDRGDPQGALLRLLTMTSQRSEQLPLFPGEALFQPIQDRNTEIVAALISRGVDLTTRNADGNTAMHVAAAKSDNADIVRRLLEAGSDIDATGAAGSTPLHCAARSADKETVKVLLQWRPNVSVTDSDGETAQTVAARNGKHSIARLLHDYGADTTTPNNPGPRRTINLPATGIGAPPEAGREVGIENETHVVPPPPSVTGVRNYLRRTALHEAVQDGDEAAVVSLLAAGADVNLVDSTGRMALHLAAAEGHTEIVRVLLANGAHIQAADEDSWTALHRAVIRGRVEVATVLLSEGANIEAVDEEGQTALHLAASRAQPDVVSVLLAQGANFEAVNQCGQTPLHLPAIRGHTEVAALLLATGANTEAADDDGQTALHRAAWSGKLEVVSVLLGNGAHMEAVDTIGRTVLYIAVKRSDIGLLTLLLANGANIEALDQQGCTELHRAASSGDAKAVAVLLGGGANIEAVDKVGCTVLHHAAGSGDPRAVIVLLAAGADIEARGPDGTALQMALANGNDVLADVLVARGAESTKLGRLRHTLRQRLGLGKGDGKEGIVVKGENESSGE